MSRNTAAQEKFQNAFEKHRAEILAHCYRFTGSRHDAEDLAQETFVRAWRGLKDFENRASLRNWLYRIATNACLNALARRKRQRRVFPEDMAGPTTQMPETDFAPEIPWIEPMPDRLLENLPDAAPGPASRFEMRDTVRLAFIAATQRLPARQRAVLLLRDVLGWSAKETADVLRMSVASVNSALQRARDTLEKGLSLSEMKQPDPEENAVTTIGAAYATAWEGADVESFVALLTKDASMAMPPRSEWYAGRTAVRRFVTWLWLQRRPGQVRFLRTRANGQLTLATYIRRPGRKTFSPHAIQVLTLRRGKIARINAFIGKPFFKGFGLPAKLDAN